MTDTYAHPEAIVTAEWVSEHLNDANVVIAEIDVDIATDYNQGHIPGAVGWGLHTDMEDQTTRDIPQIEPFEALMARSGIDNGTTVVVYGDGNNRSATWAFWVMKYYRHKDVRLMDGGRKKWLQEGRPLSLVTPTVIPKEYRAGIPDQTVRAMRDYVVQAVGKEGVTPLDTRTIEEFTGELTSAPGTAQSDIYRKGRIPGAAHVPWDDGATDDGSFLPAGELRSMYEGAGLDPSQEVIPYCRLGVRASYSWFVLKYILGYDRVRTYDGSWTEWGNSPGLPIETGPKT